MLSYLPLIWNSSGRWKVQLDPKHHLEPLYHMYQSTNAVMKVIPNSHTKSSETSIQQGLNLHDQTYQKGLATPVLSQWKTNQAQVVVFNIKDTTPLPIFLLQRVISCYTAQHIMEAFIQFMSQVHDMGYYHDSLDFHHILVAPSDQSNRNFGMFNRLTQTYDYYKFIILDMMDGGELNTEN